MVLQFTIIIFYENIFIIVHYYNYALYNFCPLLLNAVISPLGEAAKKRLGMAKKNAKQMIIMKINDQNISTYHIKTYSHYNS
jgi:hypothetical protein